MARTVFILGAGASRDAGGPLMHDFISAAEKIRKSGAADWAGASFELTFKARSRLQRAWAKAKLDIDNIESLFASFEMSRLLGRLADLSSEEVERVVPSLRDVITRTLEQSIKWTVFGEEELSAPVPYDAFAELVARAHASPLIGPVAVITFNYDLAIDYAFVTRTLPISYGMAPSATSKAVKLFKLHGSLNWFERGGTVSSIDVRPVTKSMIKTWSGNSPTLVPTQLLLTQPDLFGATGTPAPVIVPPTWSKGSHYDRLLNVWREAADALVDAENIYVMGYSLPQTDQFFKDFFALSSISDTVLNTFRVIDPVGDGATRCRALLGESVITRNCFKHHPMTFLASIPTVAQELGIESKRIPAMVKRGQALLAGNRAILEQAIQEVAQAPMST